jgi:predicted enzyme related to lactoylglutathione lyase
LIVERTDYMSVPVTDMERSTRFYEETLGLPKAPGGGGFPEFATGNVSLYLVDMSAIGQEFTAPHSSAIALRVANVDEARAELEAKGVVFDAETFDTGVCHMAMFKDPDGNQLMLHRRYAAPA